MNNAITSLVGQEFQFQLGKENRRKYSGILAAPNGSLYGIPYYARRIVKFNPVDKSMTIIGPDFDGVDDDDDDCDDDDYYYCDEQPSGIKVP